MDQLADIRRKREAEWKAQREAEKSNPPPPSEKKKEKEVVIGNKVIKDGKRQWTMGELSAVMETYYRVRPEKEAACKKAALDFNSANFFQSFLRRAEFKIPRAGILFGRVDGDSVMADALFEPPQVVDSNGNARLTDDSDWEKKIYPLAELMGLQPIGWMFSRTHEREYVLSSYELLKVADFMAKHSKYAVCAVCYVNDQGEVNFEAYQASQQCMKMCEEGLLSPLEDKPGFVKTKREVEAVKDHEEKHMKSITSKTTEVDTALFTVPVAIASFESPICTNTFSRMNRPDHMVTGQDVQNYFRDPKRKGKPVTESLNDFHLLSFLSTEIDTSPLLFAVKTQDEETARALLTPYLME